MVGRVARYAPPTHPPPQVSAVSLLLAATHMISSDWARLKADGLLKGYNKTVWAMVGLDSLGGVLVSVLLKYTSATLKNFAAPLGIILNCLLARYASADGTARPPSVRFLLGTALVVLALGTFTIG